MLKFEDKTPYYLTNNSRDFQLMTRVIDSIALAQHADIQTLTNLNSPSKCKNSMLDLLAKKVGFFTDKYIDDNVLRHIIGAFKTAVSAKGTQVGITQAVVAILKAENSIQKPQVTIVRENVDEDLNSYQVQIFTPINIVNKVALQEFLKYVIPAGWTYTIQTYQKSDTPQQTPLYGMDKVEFIQTLNTIPSIIRQSVDDFGYRGETNHIGMEDKVLGSVDVGLVSDRYSFEKIINEDRLLKEAELKSLGTLGDYIDDQGRESSVYSSGTAEEGLGEVQSNE